MKIRILVPHIKKVPSHRLERVAQSEAVKITRLFCSGLPRVVYTPVRIPSSTGSVLGARYACLTRTGHL